MSTGSIDQANLYVIVDPGDQYSVIIQQPETFTIQDGNQFFTVADFATDAATASLAHTASYVLFEDVVGLVAFSSSVVQLLDGQVSGNLSVFNAYTASTDIRLFELEEITASLELRVDSLRSVTGSYATTASNTFFGEQTISSSLKISSDGLIILSPREVPTSSIQGGIFYSSSGDFYVGM